jgi:hypothetical protein
MLLRSNELPNAQSIEETTAATSDHVDQLAWLRDRDTMRQLRQNMTGRQILLALYVLAMASLGFAHRPLALGQAPDLSAYALPDGSLPEICRTGGAGSLPGKVHAGAACDACLMTAAPGLPASDLVTGAPHWGPVSLFRPLRDRAHDDLDKPLNLRSRAPPALRIV